MGVQVCLFAYLHKLAKAVHYEEVPQFLVGIHENNFAADFPHVFEQAQNFAYTRAVDEGDPLEIDDDFVHPLIHDSVQTILEQRAALKRDLAFNADDSTFSIRINLDVHGHLGQNTVIFHRQGQAQETCHGLGICDSPS